MGYALITIVMTYPLLFQLNAGLASHTPDVWILAWDNWWIQRALAGGQDIFFTPLMFYPNGVSLAAHSFSFTHTLISSFLQVFTNPVAAFNLATFLIFPVSGLGMYQLAQRLTQSRAASFIAGLIYAFAPYYMTQALGHPHLAYVQFIPFAVLFTLKAMEFSAAPAVIASDPQRASDAPVEHRARPAKQPPEPRRRLLRENMLATTAPTGRCGVTLRPGYIIAAIIFFTLTAYAGPHLLVLAFTWLAIFLPFDFIAKKREVRRPTIFSLIAIVFGTLILSFPLYQPALSDILHGQSISELQTGEFDDTQTDALAYFIPTRYHPVFGSSLEEAYRNLGKNNLWMPYLGYTAVLLSIIGVAAWRRKLLAWLVAGLVCILLALGPELRVNGVTYSNIPLPFAVLQNMFPFSFLRTPDRFNSVVPLSLAVLAAYGLAAIERRLSRARLIITGVVSGVILFEYLNVPYPIMPLPQQSPFAAQMANASDQYAILDLPMGRNPSKVYLYWQTIHHLPMIEGHVSRTPDSAYDFIQANALLRRLRNPERGAPTDVQRSEAMKQLSDQNVRYLLVHVPMSNPDQMAQYRSIIGADPIYADDLLQVYAVSP